MENLSLSNDKTNFYDNSLALLPKALRSWQGPEDTYPSLSESIDDTTITERSIEGPEDYVSHDIEDLE
ncbi:hypothetical protein H0X48_02130 [Candidatus Dependentiae bacterium]|nr:hypothetical protein [Candidatus Dependentiae bacterium]